MQKIEGVPHAPFSNLKLCGAKTRSNGHKPCRQPAMANGRCRLHGGKSTGPKTEEGKRKSALANLKHGLYTKDAVAEQKEYRAMLRWYDNSYSI